MILFPKKITCVSCQKKTLEKDIKYTNRNGEKLALCQKCWSAAIQIQDALRPVNFADATRERYLMNQKEIKNGRS